LSVKIEVEIRTIVGTWITPVDDQELEDRNPGAAAGDVRDRIKAGEPIEARPESRGEPDYRLQDVVFNPGHVVAVVEGRRPRRWQ
jgi:hypothetical protein